jgi:hypothetical protein
MEKSDSEKIEELLALFLKNKKKIFLLTLSFFILAFLALAIAGLQLFYPYHFIIGISIYVVSFIPLIRRIYLSRKSIQEYKIYQFSEKFVKREKFHIAVVIIFTISLISFFAIRPFDKNIFTELTNEQISELITDDLYKSIAAMDYLESTGNALVGTLSSDGQNPNIAQDIENEFDEFLTAVLYSESLTDTHRFFDYIPQELSTERAHSFMISYSLFTKKYEQLHRIFVTVSGDDYKKKILNQHTELYDRDGIYDEMVVRYYRPKTRLRINAGKIYMSLFYDTPQAYYGSEYALLHNKAQNSYSYLLSGFGDTLLKSREVGVDLIKSKMFDSWLPIQKTVANTMGHIIISERGKDYFVDEENIALLQHEMEPGDIMLQRRNWHLSNIGIPGFWTHAALYTGTLSDMSEYFEPLFPFDDYVDFDSYMAGEFPEVYDQYTELNDDNDQYSVIESIEPGVVLQSLNDSAGADFVVSLRPRLTKEEKLLSLSKAFTHYGKPYDYNFDFGTRDTLVCSELIYDSYFEKLPEKSGLNFEKTIVNGRELVTPLIMAKTFKKEFGTDTAQMDFVYFIEGSEKSKTATSSTVERFLKSIDWNKFSFSQ